MAWYDQYFTPAWERRFRYQSRKVYANYLNLEEDAFQNSWLALFENLQKSKQSEMSDAYVLTAFKNLLRDEYRQHFGRCRPRTWVKKLGVFWERIAVMLCQENLPAQAIAQKISADPLPANSDTSHSEQVAFIVSQLKSKAYCSTLGRLEEQFPENMEYGDDRDSPDNNLPENELAFLLQIILNEDAAELNQSALSEHIIQQWQLLSKSLDKAITNDDRLLLILIFAEGYSVASASRALNKPTHKIRYQLSQALSSIQSVLKQHDIDLSVLND